MEPDFLLQYPNMFKTGKKNTDSSGIMEAFTGEHRKDFLVVMQNKMVCSPKILT